MFADLSFSRLWQVIDGILTGVPNGYDAKNGPNARRFTFERDVRNQGPHRRQRRSARDTAAANVTPLPALASALPFGGPPPVTDPDADLTARRVAALAALQAVPALSPAWWRALIRLFRVMQATLNRQRARATRNRLILQNRIQATFNQTNFPHTWG